MNTAMQDWKEIGALRARVAQLEAKVDEAQKVAVKLSLKLGAAEAALRTACEWLSAELHAYDNDLPLNEPDASHMREFLTRARGVLGRTAETPPSDAIDTSPKPVDKSEKDRHVERLEAALRKYGAHDIETCAMFGPEVEPCSCGFDAVMAVTEMADAMASQMETKGDSNEG
jgi:hypothetical protein